MAKFRHERLVGHLIENWAAEGAVMGMGEALNDVAETLGFLHYSAYNAACLNEPDEVKARIDAL